MTDENTAGIQTEQTNTNSVEGLKEAEQTNQSQKSENEVKSETLLASEGDKKEGETESKTEKKVLDEYEPFSMPEEFSIDSEMLDKFASIAKSSSLTQEQAQEVIDLAVEHTQGILEGQASQWSEVRKDWVKSIKEDKEFGGDNFIGTVERAKRTISKYGSKEFTEFLETTGYGDNPELIKLLARVDKATSEDKLVEGGASKSDTRSAAEIIYGNSKN